KRIKGLCGRAPPHKPEKKWVVELYPYTTQIINELIAIKMNSCYGGLHSSFVSFPSSFWLHWNVVAPNASHGT
ncbi:hypothetical protein, partial [Chromobacterium amazonense]|uniref:hypothetical protein n=1 Tax=Chromobacterium amazonense TaxID=1382803 RepID=UPI0031F63AB0